MTEGPDPLDILSLVVESIGGSARPGQVEMVRRIASAIEDEGQLLVQAGTGTGKSIGYLVPLLAHCVTTEQKALVTTATLALQRQILSKDAPRVVEAIAEKTGIRPKVAVLKGWSNYLCLHRAQGGYPTEGTLFEGIETNTGKVSDLGTQVLRLREWASTTDTGDRDELVPGVSDKAWRQVSVSKRECLGSSCPLIEECFPKAAREKAGEADLIVTNHSLFGIHCTGEAEILPEFGPVVVDEAHELSERVRTQASQLLSQGIVTRIARTIRSQAKVDAEDLENAGTELAAVLAPLEDGLMLERPEALAETMRLIDDAARRAASAIQDSGAEQAGKVLARAALDEITGFVDTWSQDPKLTILSLSRSDQGSGELLSISPLEVAPPLGLKGFSDRPAILTSATLSLGGSFDAIARECGFMMTERPFEGIDVGTPFAPEKQAIMYIAKHLPEPGPGGLSPEAGKELVELAKASGGGMLGLFSSWKAAERAAQLLREHTDLTIYMQGDETLSALVDRFREEEDSCLIGTRSLWQGVDVVGGSCRLVVIDRIPFPHLNDAVAKARSIDAERKGFSGFHTVSLTQAALLMAQGAGRLLRSAQDRGVVAILDRRVLTKSYGSFIRQSMPKMWPTTDPQLVRAALKRLATSHEAASGGKGVGEKKRRRTRA